MMHCGTIQMETERLILRRFRYEDNEDMRRFWVSDPAIQSLYCEPVYTTEAQVRELLDKYISSYEREDYYRWAIIEKESGICIGQVAIFLVDNKNHFCELEYCIGSRFHRRGYMTEAVQAVMKLAFDTVGFHKVQICHRDGNTASEGVIRKCGLTHDGTLRDFFYTEGRYYDRLYYSMLESEWNS